PMSQYWSEYTRVLSSPKMRSKQVQHGVAGIAVFLSLLMLYSAFRGWSTPGVAASLSEPKPLHPKAAAVATVKDAVKDRKGPPEPEPLGSDAHEEADTLPPFKPSALGQPYYVYPKARTNTSISVTIVIVVTVGTKMAAFATALNSVQCYAALHGYTVAVDFDDKFKECAVHKDKFFRRHCHTHRLMQTEINEGDWALFIDGDVGVVNPKHLIEEYMEEGYEIYLFDRFYNWEYAALSYLVKNNKRGRGWVEEFSRFEFKLPSSFHGTDNGALHPFLMHYLVPETRDEKTRSRTAALCLSLWKRSGG
ncbi:hypothetical protein PRIPAC_94466, partial [Pristionchus pacificus]